MTSTLRRLLPTFSDPQPTAGYWMFVGHLLTVFGLALSNMFLGLMAIWTFRHRRELPWDGRRNAYLLVPLGFFVVFFLVSVIMSLEPAISAGEIKDVLSFVTLALAPALVRGEQQVRRIFDWLLGLIAFLAAHGIWQFYFTEYGELHQRIVGLFSHYQTFSGVLLIGLLLAVGRLATEPGRANPWNWLALAIIVWTLMLSLTRGAWVAAAITLLLFALLRFRKLFLPMAVAAAVFFALLAPDSWTERLSSIVDLQDSSNYDRLCMAEAALFMISERPLFGIGPEAAEARYPIYRHPSAPRFNVPHLHNSFLQRAAEQGLLSLLAYLWLIAAGLLLAYRAYRREGGAHGPRADLYTAVLLILVGFNIAGLFEDNWRDTEVRRLVLFFLAVPLCLPAPKTATLSDESEP